MGSARSPPIEIFSTLGANAYIQTKKPAAAGSYLNFITALRPNVVINIIHFKSHFQNFKLKIADF